MKRVKNQKKICVVQDCMRRSTIDNELSFHSFPRRGKSYIEITTKLGIKETVDRHLEWMKRLKILKHHSDMFVCSQHFAPTDYYLPQIPVKTRVLKRTAVPTRNLPESTSDRRTSEKVEQRNIQRADRRRRRQKQISENSTKIRNISDDDRAPCVAGTSAFFVVPVLEEAPENPRETADDRLLPLHKDCTNEQSNEQESTHVTSQRRNHRVTDKRTTGTQSKLNDIFVASILLQSDDSLSAVSGIQNHPVLNEIVSLTNKYYPRVGTHDLSPRERIILTSIKLQTDASFAALATLFGCTNVSACRRIFIETLRKLSSIMRSVVQRLPGEEIPGKLPKSFRDFENTVFVLDRIELSLEKPNCSQCRDKTYSPGKSDFTAKFMTGVTPGGTIIYVSDVYGGRVNDAGMFEQSNLIDRLTRDDAIMTDGKFAIEDICKERKIDLYRPLEDKQTLSQEDTFFNRKIALARIHADRMNQRIRRFVILKRRISCKLMPHLQDIVLVCCAFANLGTPIISSHEFMLCKEQEETMEHLITCEKGRELISEKARKEIEEWMDGIDEWAIKRELINMLSGQIQNGICEFFREIEDLCKRGTRKRRR